MIDRIFAAPRKLSAKQGIDFSLANELGYEISSFSHIENIENSASEIDNYRTLLKGFRGTLAMSAAVSDLNVVSTDPDIRKVSQARYLQSIEIAKALDVKYLIFHSQWNLSYSKSDNSSLWVRKMSDYWQELIAEHLEESALTILLENFMDPVPDYMMQILTQVSSSHLKACLDTGHINLFSDKSPVDWLDDMRSQVAYIHAHNNAGNIDSHDSFKDGLLDMESFLNHLALTPQKIHLAIETSDLASLEESYDMIKPYIALQNEQFTSKSFLI